MPEQPAPPEFSRPVAPRLLSRGSEIAVREVADEAEKARLARLFDAVEVRKFRLSGTLRPAQKGAWGLEARLSATVVQSCVVTLEPVVSLLDERVERLWLPGGALRTGDIVIDTEGEEEVEALEDGIALGLVAMEAAALALPPYPRAENAPEIAEPEPAAEDETRRPFAALADLKAKLEGGG